MAAWFPRACTLVLGTVSSSIWAIFGTVNLRVLSFGPLAASPSLPVSSLGTLKLPGSELFVAVASRRPPPEKDAMSAPPAANLSRGGQALAHPPLVQRPVVVGGVRGAKAVKHEGGPRRRNPAVAVGDQGHV